MTNPPAPSPGLEVGDPPTPGLPEPAVGTEAAHGRGLPWWRRRRRLRRQLAGTLVLVALASVLVVGGLNFVAARELLDDGTKDQLVGVGEARARSIDRGIERTLAQTSAFAADLDVVESLLELDAAFTGTTERLSGAQEAEIEQIYQQSVVEPLNTLPLEQPLTLEEVLPTTARGLYAQYHYTLGDFSDGRRDVDDAGDGSAYSDVHARLHPRLRQLADDLGWGDLLLVNTGGDVIYSVEKRIDFGTNLFAGPYRETSLADTVRNGLSRVPVGDAVLADLELYVPGGALPVAFAMAAVRSGTEVIGTLVAQIPVSSLNAITTANERWEEVGLSTGESYVVDRFGILVSESRQWIEDPARYLERVDDPVLAEFIETLDSPVGLQPVDTAPVEAALGGETFEGTSRNYLGQRMFTYATPIDAEGVEWVVVADIPLDEARGPLYDYARTLGLVLVLVLPIAAAVGLWMARRLTRSIPPLVTAAQAVAAGERRPAIPELGRDEFGDLARRLASMTRELEAQERALAAEYEDRRQLLLTVLPQRMVEADGAVTGGGDIAETATVVAVTLQASTEDLVLEDADLARLYGTALAEAEELAARYGLERVRAAADQYLFLAGIGSPEDEADDALAFAVDVAAAIDELSRTEEVPLDVHVGLSSGPIATGMLERGDLTFAAWGEPVRRALALGALSRADEVLVDVSTAASASVERWTLTPATDVIDLDGTPMELFAVNRATDTADAAGGHETRQSQ